MVKRTLAIIMAVVLLGTMMPLAIAQGTPTITVSSATAAPGETVELKVSISDNPGINAFELGFRFDTTKLKLKDVKKTDGLSGQLIYGKKAVWFNAKDVDFDGDYLHLTFEVAPSAPNGKAEVEVVCDWGDIANYQEESIDFVTVPGTVMIEGAQENMEALQPEEGTEKEAETEKAERPSILKSVGAFFQSLWEHIKAFFSDVYHLLFKRY